MTKSFFTIMLLVISNVFMTIAWYGHLKFQEWGWLKKTALWSVILISWGFALFEYIFQVPANRMGFKENGGPFSLFQLKVIQEVITLLVFTVFTIIFFKTESLKWNHLAAFFCLILAVYFVFKK
ncbi:DMT family protein [Cloacibacterium sp.]|uniref:DMT family protein n=1 Tax=Cloacibacterium sp. TaxID=1913682 RepID=UPI0035B0BFF6